MNNKHLRRGIQIEAMASDELGKRWVPTGPSIETTIRKVDGKMSQPRDHEWSNRSSEALRGLAKVIREHGTCPPMALETIADRLETPWPYGWVDPKTLSFINHETKVNCGPSCKNYTVPVYTSATDLSKPPMAPSDDYVVIPRDVTMAMFDAGFAAIEKQYHADPLDDYVAKVNAIWWAMLRAATDKGGF